jgi:folate-binding protein YgfZ
VEAGIPWYGVDMDDTNFPQEARVDYVLDWNKGCYVGQEPVARIKFRGHVNKKLVGLRFGVGSGPEPGNKIFGNRESRKEIGHITTAVYSPHLHCPIALGYVRRAWLADGTEVVVETAQGVVPAVVAALPFYPDSPMVA